MSVSAPVIIRVRLVDQVAAVLRDMIITDRLKPGEHLLQEKLASDLSVSRTPLREALLKLQEEGLVTLSGTRGVEVATHDASQIIELLDVREALDALAAKLAARKASPQDTAQIKSVVDKEGELVERLDLHEWLLLNVQFHGAITEASHNRALRQLSSYIQTSSRMVFRTLMVTPQRLVLNFKEHQHIYEAIAAGDAEAAELAAKTHIANNKEVVRQWMRDPAPGGAHVP